MADRDNPDRQVFQAASGLGCVALAAGIVLLPPAFLPLLAIYQIASAASQYVHPALGIVVALGAAWLVLAGASWLLRKLPLVVGKALMATYLGACYSFIFFQRELTTARNELDLGWFTVTFAVFAVAGWKIGGSLAEAGNRRMNS